MARQQAALPRVSPEQRAEVERELRHGRDPAPAGQAVDGAHLPGTAACGRGVRVLHRRAHSSGLQPSLYHCSTALLPERLTILNDSVARTYNLRAA